MFIAVNTFFALKVHYGLCSVGAAEIVCHVHVKYTYLCSPQFFPPIHFSHLSLKPKSHIHHEAYLVAKKPICSKLVCSSELPQWLHQKINRDLCLSLCNSLVIWSQRMAQGTTEIFKQELLLPTCRLLHLCNVK